MTLERRCPNGPLDEARLLAFERSLPAPLPGDYRSFLVEFNGAAPVDCVEFAEIPGGTSIEALFGLHEGPPHFRLDSTREGFADTVPASLLVIASDPYGN